MTSIIIPGPVVRPDFDETEHRYTVKGVVVPSVTRILRPLTQDVYGDIDEEVLSAKAEFGTAVHACTELLDADDLDEESIEEIWEPMISAYRKWKADVCPKILACEDRLGCSKYCGTIDRIVEINDKPWVIDIKTTSQIHDHVGVQLAAYEALASKFYGVPKYRRAALQLRSDGTYRFVEFKSFTDETCFNALLGIYHWQKSHGTN